MVCHLLFRHTMEIFHYSIFRDISILLPLLFNIVSVVMHLKLMILYYSSKISVSNYLVL